MYPHRRGTDLARFFLGDLDKILRGHAVGDFRKSVNVPGRTDAELLGGSVAVDADLVVGAVTFDLATHVEELVYAADAVRLRA